MYPFIPKTTVSAWACPLESLENGPIWIFEEFRVAAVISSYISTLAHASPRSRVWTFEEIDKVSRSEYRECNTVDSCWPAILQNG